MDAIFVKCDVCCIVCELSMCDIMCDVLPVSVIPLTCHISEIRSVHSTTSVCTRCCWASARGWLVTVTLLPADWASGRWLVCALLPYTPLFLLVQDCGLQCRLYLVEGNMDHMDCADSLRTA